MSFFAKTLEFVNESGRTSGHSVIRDNAHSYYELTKLTGSNGAAISNGNAGLVDQTGNGHTATIIGTPVIRDVTINAVTTKTLHDESTNAINTNTTGATFLHESFEVYIVIQMQDGQPVATQNLLGGIKPTNIGLNIYVDTAGKIGVALGTTSGFFNFITTAAVFVNGVNDTACLRIRVAYGSTVSVYKNGVNQPGTFSAGTINTPTASQVPTDFTTNMYIGALNNNGTTTSNVAINSIFKVLFISLLSSSDDFQMNAVQEELMDFTYSDWQTKEIHVTAANYTTYRTNLISTLFNGGSLPTISPTVTTGITGVIHICNTTNITNDASWDRLTFATTDIDGATWSHKCYLGHTNQTPNNKLLIINNGHASDVASAYESLMSQALGYGYDVLYTSMPVVGDNTETSAKVTSTSSTGHNQMLSNGLDQVGYNPIELFLFDKISAVNYLDSSYDEIYMTGNSGGGWCTVLCAAVDERIKISIPNRGVALRSMKYRETGIDFEQGGMPSYTWTPSILGSLTCGTRQYTNFTDITYFDMIALCTTNGRIVQRQSHFADDCCFVGSTSFVWADIMKTLAGTLGGEFHNIIDFNNIRASHRFSTYDISNIFHILGDL